MNLIEPKHIQDQCHYLDNFADLNARTKVLEKGLFSEVPNLSIPNNTNISSFDEFVTAVQSDYYLNKLVNKKLHYLYQDNEMYKIAKHLVEIYLTAESTPNQNSKKIQTFALSNLNLI